MLKKHGLNFFKLKKELEKHALNLVQASKSSKTMEDALGMRSCCMKNARKPWIEFFAS